MKLICDEELKIDELEQYDRREKPRAAGCARNAVRRCDPNYVGPSEITKRGFSKRGHLYCS